MKESRDNWNGASGVEEGAASTSRKSRDSRTEVMASVSSSSAWRVGVEFDAKRQAAMENLLNDPEEAGKSTGPETRKPLTLKEYAKHFASLESRCDVNGPSHRYLDQNIAARMMQLVERYPGGVEADVFLGKLWLESKITIPQLNGYSFPKDGDEEDTFKLTKAFWIPDNDRWGVRRRIVFPRKTYEKYHGSLRNLLIEYWEKLKTCMKELRKVRLDEVMHLSEDEFYELTKMEFSYKAWRLESYGMFLEFLVQSFDPKHEHLTILPLVPAYGETREPIVYLCLSGETAEALERESKEEHNAKIKAMNEAIERIRNPPKADLGYTMKDLDFAGFRSIRNTPKVKRTFDVVTPGNVQKFSIFSVIRTSDISKWDAVLQRIQEEVEGQQEFTVPKLVQARTLVVFMNEWKLWRRGLIMDYDQVNGTAEILDVDTGEVTAKVKNFRNITPSLIQLPVFRIPVRFSMDQESKAVFLAHQEVDETLGKLLHQEVRELNRGLRLKFYRVDKSAWYFNPGVWVVNGHLINIWNHVSITPPMSVAKLVLGQYQTWDPTREFPIWDSEARDGGFEDWTRELENREFTEINRYYLSNVIYTPGPNSQSGENVPMTGIFVDPEHPGEMESESTPSKNRRKGWMYHHSPMPLEQLTNHDANGSLTLPIQNDADNLRNQKLNKEGGTSRFRHLGRVQYKYL